MIPIHEDILHRVQQIVLLFWRAQITPSIRIYAKLRKGNIYMSPGLSDTQEYTKGYTISGANKTDNRYSENEDLH